MFRKFAPYRYLAARSRLNGGNVYSCHVQVNQLLTAQRVNVRDFLARAVADNWRILYMTRQDIVRQSISTILAKRRRQWYVYDSQELDMQPQVIKWEELQPWLQRRVDHAKIEMEALDGLPHLTVTYEHDLRDAPNHQSTMDRVFAYLDLPTIHVQAETKRLSGDLPDTVANYDELMAAVCHSSFALYTDLC